MYDFDTPSAFRQVVRRARVAHRCCECRQAIPVKSRYQYTSGVWDGCPASYKTCLDCADARVFLMGQCLPREDHGPCFTQLWDGILGDYREEVEAALRRVFLVASALATGMGNVPAMNPHPAHM